MNPLPFLLRVTVGGWAAWAPLAVAQTPATLGVQLDGEHVGIKITGQVGQVYHIETTTNLGPPTVWTPFNYLKLSASPHFYVDTRALADGGRFYRTRESNVLPITNMVFIPPGTFMMGSPASEAEHGSDETQHPVALTRGFWMGKYEVTQGEYGELMGINPSYFRNGKTSYGGGNGGTVTNELRHPVEKVSWDDATNYCGELTQRQFGAGHIPVGWRYRLPTESEWEYACRAGTTTPFHHGQALREGMANFDIHYAYESMVGTITTSKIYLGRTTDVGSYVANAHGLYDMEGNVWEWCQDWHGTYPTTFVTDPRGRALGTYRTFRGGSWLYYGEHCRSAERLYNYPTTKFNDIGFRVVLAEDQ